MESDQEDLVDWIWATVHEAGIMAALEGTPPPVQVRTDFRGVPTVCWFFPVSQRWQAFQLVSTLLDAEKTASNRIRLGQDAEGLAVEFRPPGLQLPQANTLLGPEDLAR